MDRQEKEGTAYLFLSLLTVIFLIVALLLVRSAPPQPGSYTVTASRSAPEARELPVPGKIDINSAPAEELERLTGIGPALAAEIVAYREEHGPFTAEDELLAIKGIGEKTLAGFRGEITIGGKAP